MNQHFIGGQWVTSNGQQFSSNNPVTQETVWRGNAASAATVDAAVSVARAAFPAWADLNVEALLRLNAIFTAPTLDDFCMTCATVKIGRAHV